MTRLMRGEETARCGPAHSGRPASAVGPACGGPAAFERPPIDNLDTNETGMPARPTLTFRPSQCGGLAAQTGWAVVRGGPAALWCRRGARWPGAGRDSERGPGWAVRVTGATRIRPAESRRPCNFTENRIFFFAPCLFPCLPCARARRARLRGRHRAGPGETRHPAPPARDTLAGARRRPPRMRSASFCVFAVARWAAALSRRRVGVAHSAPHGKSASTAFWFMKC